MITSRARALLMTESVNFERGEMSTNNTASPLISVVIPAYNYAASLARAAQSILGQRDERTELLIVDDGSTDATSEVVKALHLGYPGQFRSIRKDNGGAASARNLGLRESAGDWLVFLDADDEFVPGALGKLAEHIQSNPDSRLVIGEHISVSEEGHRRRHKNDPIPDRGFERVKAYLLDKTLGLSNGACAMHREVFEQGGYPEHFRNSEDLPVFAQALARYPVSTLAEPLLLLYKHGDSLRHHVGHGQAVGTQVVDEVFSRLPAEMQSLRDDFYAQRCLSLFRSAYLAKDREAAKKYYSAALRNNWRLLLKASYTRKAIRLWLGKR